MKVRDLPRFGLSVAQQGLTRRLPFIQKQIATRLDLLPEVVRPIIILPGVLGTWPPALAPRGRLDPITKVYHNLVDGLERIGYVPGVSLFAFPYDWRQSVADLSVELGAEIERIRQLSPDAALKRSSVPVDYSQVDLLCHSMGGLIGRAYVQSENYAGAVARLMLVAVPQYGSVAAYYAYEGGDSTLIGIPVQDAQAMIALLETREAKSLPHKARHIYRTIRRQDLPDLYNYNREQLRSIRDLLPLGAQNYLYQIDEVGQEQLYPFGPRPGYPVNPLIEELNRPEALARLDRLDEIYFVYSGSALTPGRIRVKAPSHSPLYTYGEPLTPQLAEDQLPGDRVVSVISARLQLPELKPDGQPWRVKLRYEELSKTLGRSINHVEIVADPAPVRQLLAYFARPGLERLDPSIWDGPPIATRRPNFAPLFI